MPIATFNKPRGSGQSIPQNRSVDRVAVRRHPPSARRRHRQGRSQHRRSRPTRSAPTASGTLDFRNETLDLSIKPQLRRGVTLEHRSIRVTGALSRTVQRADGRCRRRRRRRNGCNARRGGGHGRHVAARPGYLLKGATPTPVHRVRSRSVRVSRSPTAAAAPPSPATSRRRPTSRQGARQAVRALTRVCAVAASSPARPTSTVTSAFKHRLQAKPRYARDLRERLVEFGGAIVLRAVLAKRFDDRRPIEALHGDDERKAELGVVGAVERGEAREFLGRALGQPGAALLALRILRSSRRESPPCRRVPDAANHCELRLDRCAPSARRPSPRAVHRRSRKGGRPRRHRRSTASARRYRRALDERTTIERVDFGKVHSVVVTTQVTRRAALIRPPGRDAWRSSDGRCRCGARSRPCRVPAHSR